MRTALTLIRHHGEDKFQVVCGPEVSIEEQKTAVKKLAAGAVHRTHPEIAEVQLWRSDAGLTKRHRFDLPKAKATEPQQPAPTKPAGDSDAQNDLQKKNVDELRALAKSLGIDVAGLKKPDLITAIQNATK